MVQAFKMLDKLDEIEHDEKGCLRNGFIIDNSSKTKMVYDCFTTLCYLMCYAMIPYNIAFGLPDTDGSTWAKTEILLNYIIFIDILANFVTVREVDASAPVTNKLLASRYLRQEFLFDMLSCFPAIIRSLVVTKLDNGDSYWYLLKLFRFA